MTNDPYENPDGHGFVVPLLFFGAFVLQMRYEFIQFLKKRFGAGK